MATTPPSNSTVTPTDPASSSSFIASSTSSSILSSLSSSLSDTATTSNAASATPVSSQPPTTIISTSVTTISSNGSPLESQTVVTTTFITTPPASTTPGTTSSSTSSSATATNSAALQSGNKSSSQSSGLGVGAKTAIAVVIPVVVVAILVGLAIFWWRKRKQRKNEEEQRRKEMEDYGYNPNNDPTLPAVAGASGSQMAEDHSGYRGWGGAGTMTSGNTRKASTTLSGGMAGGLSDNGSQPGGYHSPGSPSMGTTDGHSSDPLMSSRREPYEADGVGALGAAPAAGAGRGDIRRGPSNASSSYSAGDRSHHSAEAPIPVGNGYDDHYGDNAYYQAGPYDGVAYGGGAQPIVRDVQARRNTRIEEPRVRPGQGNSGIAQNF